MSKNKFDPGNDKTPKTKETLKNILDEKTNIKNIMLELITIKFRRC